MGGVILDGLQSSNSASLATDVIIPDTDAKLVRQRSVSLCSIRQLLKYFHQQLRVVTRPSIASRCSHSRGCTFVHRTMPCIANVTIHNVLVCDN